MTLDVVRIAAALHVLADAIEGTTSPGPAVPTGTLPTEPVKRGRGRPVKGEDTTAPAPATSPAVVESDPFETKPAAPTATLEEVRASLTLLRAATSQDNALKVLTVAGEAPNLTDLKPENYGKVIAAATAALPPVKTTPTAETPDPFATTPSAEPVKAYTIEDVKAAVVEAQKKTSMDTAQKIVMKHGGIANVAGQAPGPSLKALPVEQFAATIAALKALPATK